MLMPFSCNEERPTNSALTTPEEKAHALIFVSLLFFLNRIVLSLFQDIEHILMMGHEVMSHLGVG